MTNYEKLKSMSIDELIDTHILTCRYCIYYNGCNADRYCDEVIRRWLESEAE